MHVVPGLPTFHNKTNGIFIGLKEIFAAGVNASQVLAGYA